jgi:hypothetical protein
MHVYELSFGAIKHFIAAKDEGQAYEKGTDPKLFPDIHYLPFTITQVKVEGYDITLTPTKAEHGTVLDDLDRDGLKEWLNERSIEYTPQWGEQKLRELALQHV